MILFLLCCIGRHQVTKEAVVDYTEGDHCLIEIEGQIIAIEDPICNYLEEGDSLILYIKKK